MIKVSMSLSSVITPMTIMFLLIAFMMFTALAWAHAPMLAFAGMSTIGAVIYRQLT